MPSLMELVERVNKGELLDADQLSVYEESANSAEKFLAHHAHAMLDLRRAQQHMMQSLEAIDYSDQKVLNQFVSVSGFLGLTDLRTGPVVKFGASAIGRREYPLGLEALSNGMSFDLQHGGAYSSDHDNCLWVAAQYDKAAQSIGWRSDESLNWGNHQQRIAIVVSGIADDDASSRALLSLAKYYDSKRFKLHIYSTEAGVRREKQFFAQGTFVVGSAKRGIGVLEALGQKKVPAWIGSTEGDLVSAAKELANQLVLDKIDAILIDATQADAIAALIASWEVARVKINLCRRSPLYSPGISAITYSDRAKFESEKAFWSQRNVTSQFIMEGVDIEDVAGSTAPNRTAYGIPDNAIVLASAGPDLDRTVSDQFVETIINVLRSHPHAIYLLIGEGELSWQKRKFESSGVGKRVGYAGRRKDMPGFLRIADIYVSEFPAGSAASVLQAMSVERPVLAPTGSDAANIVGSDSESVAEPASYIERLSKLIREPAQRAKIGKSLKQRVEEQFAYSQTARSIEQICDELLSKAESTSSGSSIGEATAQAA